MAQQDRVGRLPGLSNEAAFRSEQEPFPWLLDGSNPSARYLTLRDLFGSDASDPRTAAAQAAIPEWRPVRRILSAADPVDLWGRKTRPFYGGPIGTHATLCLLAELGLPPLPVTGRACENLLEYGQHEAGGFSYDEAREHVVLCYTGTSIRALSYFGYAGDRRVRRAVSYLTERALDPAGGACPFCEAETCTWGLTQSLGAFAALPRAHLTGLRAAAVRRLAGALLDHEFAYDGPDANWLAFGFPHHYSTDLTDLCDVLARLGYGTDARFERLMAPVLSARTDDGRWIKGQGTRALLVEPRGSPSKWITIRVLRAIRVATRSRAEAARSRLHSSSGEYR
jgi:hypothetical protein